MNSAHTSLPPDVQRMNATANLVYGAVALVVLAASLLWLLRQPVFAIAHIVVRAVGAPRHGAARVSRAAQRHAAGACARGALGQRRRADAQRAGRDF